MAEFDDKLRDDIRSAYDQVRLPDAAKEDMLQALLKAADMQARASSPAQAPDSPGDGAGMRMGQDARIPVAVDGDGGAQRAEAQRRAPAAVSGEAEPRNVSQLIEQASPKRRPRVLRFALPAAACLIVALVAGVVAFRAPMAGDDAAQMATIEYAAEESADSADGSDAASGQSYASSDEQAEQEDASAAESLADSYAEEQKAPAESDMLNAASPEAQMEPEAGPDGEQDAATSTDGPESGQASDLKDATVLLPSGDELHPVLDGVGKPQPVEEAKIVRYVGEATLVWDDGRNPQSCELYLVEDGSYAIALAGDGAYYLVQAGN